MKDLLTNKLMIAFMIAVCVLSFAVGKNDSKIDEQKNAVAVLSFAVGKNDSKIDEQKNAVADTTTKIEL